MIPHKKHFGFGFVMGCLGFGGAGGGEEGCFCFLVGFGRVGWFS